MKKIIQLKDFSYILRVNRNSIIDTWLDCEDVKNIFGIHQIVVTDELKKSFL